MAQLIFEAVTKYGPLLALLFQAAVLFRFIDSRNRDYPLAILFSFVLFLLTTAGYFFDSIGRVLPVAAALAVKQNFIEAYYGGDLFMHILLLALMLQLIRKTLKGLELESRVIYLLAALSVLVAVCAFVWFGAEFNGLTLLKTRQVVSFWMVLLNLYWWTLLIRKRQLDRRVLLLSAGVGLMMTGQVIGDGLAAFAGTDRFISLLAALIMYATHFACLYAWFNAFRPGYAIVPSPARA